jgi:recombination protein RecR
VYSPSINNLIRQLKKLPSVGVHTAERFVFYWLRSGKKDVTELMLALKELIENVKSCEMCWNFSDQSPCPICTDIKRDQSLICIVASPQDLAAIEQIHEYRGRYHVLRGTLDAADEESIQRLKIKELLDRITIPPPAREGARGRGSIQEIILALNPDLPGETTMMYLQKKIKELNPTIKITRLARGLPMGSDVQYADEITLASALKNRI